MGKNNNKSVKVVHGGQESSEEEGPVRFKPISKKPTEVRMGKGKGSTEYWAARVKPGRVMFEIDGVSEDIAREALRLGARKLSVKTRFVQRIAD